MQGSVKLNVIDAKTNKIVKTVEGGNVVVDGHISELARLMSEGDGSSTHYISKMQFGTGTVPELSTDTALQSAITPLKSVTVTYPTDYQVKFTAYLQNDEGNGFSIGEVGLLTVGNTLMARKTFTSTAKTADYIFEIEWTLKTK